jgi:anti-anti-sigma regulatory factor
MIVTTACKSELANETGVEDELFHVELRPSASCDLLVLAGGISLDAVRQLSDAALQTLAGGREVAVDWSGARYLSAGSLQVLLALKTALDARGQVLSVAGDNTGVRHTLALAGLSQLFPVRQGAR